MNTTQQGRNGTAFAFPLALVALLAGCSEQAETPGQQAQTEQPAAAVATIAGETCVAHGAPKNFCFICDPSLREPGRLWCREHARYEDRCWLCHPELEDKDRLFCKEHALYEDECFLCHPELIEEGSALPEDAAGAAASGDSKQPLAAGLMCREHGVLESECGICHPELLTSDTTEPGLKVRLPSAESAAKAGVVVGTPGTDGLAYGVEAFAELSFNQNKLAQITPLVDGVVRRVLVDLGSRVNAGDVLTEITSVAIGEAQGAYLKALAEERLRTSAAERERNLRTQNISSERELQEAEAARQAASASVQQARQRLLVLGFDEDQIQELTETSRALGVLEVRAPFAGEIVERTAVQGAIAEMGRPLFTLVDTSTIWATVNIPESQLRDVEVGQTVELTVESLPDQTFTGQLTWIAANVDERTRMARARVEVANPHGRLRAHMFARAFIVTSRSDQALIVPQSALQHVSGMPLVFVQTENDLFEVRPVRLGAKHNDYVEIAAGLHLNDPVVTQGSFTLKSQFLLSRLGAGCVNE